MASRLDKNYGLYRRYLKLIVTMYEDRQDIQMFTELILSLIAIIVFGAFAIRPTLVTIAGLFSEIDDKEKTAEILEQKALDLRRAESIFNTERNRLTLLDAAVPTLAAPELYVRQIEGISKQNGVSLLSLRISEANVLGDRDEIEIEEDEVVSQMHDSFESSVSVSGSYGNLSDFLVDLENMRRPLTIDTMGLSVSEDLLGGASELIMSVEVSVPYLQ